MLVSNGNDAPQLHRFVLDADGTFSAQAMVAALPGGAPDIYAVCGADVNGDALLLRNDGSTISLRRYRAVQNDFIDMIEAQLVDLDDMNAPAGMSRQDNEWAIVVDNTPQTVPALYAIRYSQARHRRARRPGHDHRHVRPRGRCHHDRRAGPGRGGIDDGTALAHLLRRRHRRRRPVGHVQARRPSLCSARSRSAPHDHERRDALARHRRLRRIPARRSDAQHQRRRRRVRYGDGRAAPRRLGRNHGHPHQRGDRPTDERRRRGELLPRRLGRGPGLPRSPAAHGWPHLHPRRGRLQPLGHGQRHHRRLRGYQSRGRRGLGQPGHPRHAGRLRDRQDRDRHQGTAGEPGLRHLRARHHRHGLVGQRGRHGDAGRQPHRRPRDALQFSAAFQRDQGVGRLRLDRAVPDHRRQSSGRRHDPRSCDSG